MITNDFLLLAALLLLGALAVGCGSEALKINANVARAMLEVQAESGPVIRELRINASVDAGRSVHDSGGTEPEAQAAARHAANGWQCAIDGHSIYAGAVGAYIDALALWLAGADFDLSDAFPFVARAIEAYTALRSCLDSLDAPELDPIVIENPTFLQLVPPAWNIEGVL